MCVCERERERERVTAYFLSIHILNSSSLFIHRLIKLLVQIPHTTFSSIFTTIFSTCHSNSPTHTQITPQNQKLNFNTKTSQFPQFNTKSRTTQKHNLNTKRVSISTTHHKIKNLWTHKNSKEISTYPTRRKQNKTKRRAQF